MHVKLCEIHFPGMEKSSWNGGWYMIIWRKKTFENFDQIITLLWLCSMGRVTYPIYHIHLKHYTYPVHWWHQGPPHIHPKPPPLIPSLTIRGGWLELKTQCVIYFWKFLANFWTLLGSGAPTLTYPTTQGACEQDPIEEPWHSSICICDILPWCLGTTPHQES